MGTLPKDFYGEALWPPTNLKGDGIKAARGRV